MSHFYGTLQGNRGEATRCATKSSGLTAQAAGWRGCIEVRVEHDPDTGKDVFTVHLTPWKGSGGSRKLLADGVLDASMHVTPSCTTE